jgi:hypothetical protein
MQARRSGLDTVIRPLWLRSLPGSRAALQHGHAQRRMMLCCIPRRSSAPRIGVGELGGELLDHLTGYVYRSPLPRRRGYSGEQRSMRRDQA